MKCEFERAYSFFIAFEFVNLLFGKPIATTLYGYFNDSWNSDKAKKLKMMNSTMVTPAITRRSFAIVLSIFSGCMII